MTSEHALDRTVDHLSTTSSSAPASAASAPRSSSRRTARPTSWSSRRAPTSAAPGATTPTPARRATSRASSTRSRSLRYDWPSSYSPQPDIQAYIKQVADESGTLDRFVFDTPVEDAAWDDETQRWTVRTNERHLGLPDPRRRRRRPLGAQAPRHRGDRHLPGRRLPLRPVEPRRRPDRQAGGRDRHRRLGDPDRARAAEDPAGHRRPPRRLPAHRAVDHPAQRPALRHGSSGPRCGGSPGCGSSTAPASTGRTRPTCRRSPSSRGSRRRHGRWP